ncbi:MAG: STAS domain-containing protein [Pseudomonadales bacterium]
MSASEAYEKHPGSIVLRLSLGEHFDYRSIHTFRNLYTGKLQDNVYVVIDMAATRYVDSSGVALLHCLQYWINASIVTVQVINCCPELSRILTLSKLSPNIHVD